MAGYIGRIPLSEAIQSRAKYTATNAQTSFSFSYQPGFLDVYLDGVHLENAVDYTATTGTTIVLTSGAITGQVLEAVGLKTFSLISGKINYSATSAPGAGDDNADGYRVGSMWIDVTNDESYRCVDDSTGAAVWIGTTLETSDLGSLAMVTPSGTGSTSNFLRGDNSWATAGSTSASDLTSGTLPIARIADDAITNAKMADDAIDSAQIADGSIDTVHIADSQITAAKIGADAVTADKIGDDVINSEHIAADSIDAEHLNANSVNTDAIIDDSVTSAHLAAGAVDGTAIANDAVDSQHIAADSIDAEHYAAGSVDTTALGADAVDGTKLADDAVESEHIAAGAVDDAHLATGIDAAKLTTGTLPIARLSGITVAKTNVATEGQVEANTFVTADGSGYVNFGDNEKIRMGAGNDLEIYHSGSHSFIKNGGTGVLHIQGNNSSDLKVSPHDGEDSVVLKANGAVELYHDNTKKLETSATGITVTGVVAATTLTGDGSGLTGVEAATKSATVPGSPSEGDFWFNTSGSTVSGVQTKAMAVYNGTGWNQLSNTPASADGGTKSVAGGYTYHAFTTSGNFNTGAGFSATCQTLIIAGGAGGSYGSNSWWGQGGAGAGGVIYNASQSTTESSTYAIVIGAGGAGATSSGYGTQGEGGAGTNTTGFGSTAIGGGSGGTDPSRDGNNGGSGGGASWTGSGGSPTSGQGNAGGAAGTASSGNLGGGGGGKGAAGTTSGGNSPGHGGAGADYSGTYGTTWGVSGWFGGGGGGGWYNSATSTNGGQGGGGDNGATQPSAGQAGTANTGGGAGASHGQASPAGGSGIVLIRYTTPT